MGKDEDAEYQKILNKLKQDFNDKWNKKSITKTVKTIHDFEQYQTLGTGAFGRVILARDKSSHKFYAIKVLRKAKIVKLRQVQHTLNEKNILKSINFPFVIFMEYSFKDNTYIYFVLPFINGGDMFTHLQKKQKFDETLAKFYAAQVLLTLEYLHHLDLIYRDLKPENILIDYKGYLKVSDFGFCKIVKDRTWTFCGTPEYIAPEIILCKGYGKSADWWSFGVLIYEMSAGHTPFYSHFTLRVYEKIIEGKFQFAKHFSSDLKDLLYNILQTDLSKRIFVLGEFEESKLRTSPKFIENIRTLLVSLSRLDLYGYLSKFGNLKNGARDIKTHRWFREINWLHIYHRKIKPPFHPTCTGPGDASNFDRYPEEQLMEESTDRYQIEFRDF